MPQIDLDLIRKTRRSKEFTQDEMAEALHLPRVLYNRRERGDVSFKVSELPILAKKLERSIQERYKK